MTKKQHDFPYDHLVLTVRSVETTCSFCIQAFGCTRDAGCPLHFGRCKINVHGVEHSSEPKATTPTPGAADFRLITEQNLDGVADHCTQKMSRSRPAQWAARAHVA
jgi:hypothetical protein